MRHIVLVALEYALYGAVVRQPSGAPVEVGRVALPLGAHAPPLVHGHRAQDLPQLGDVLQLQNKCKLVVGQDAAEGLEHVLLDDERHAAGRRVLPQAEPPAVPVRVQAKCGVAEGGQVDVIRELSLVDMN